MSDKDKTQPTNNDQSDLDKEELKLLKLKRLEKERQEKWEEDWNNKLKEEERIESCKACCSPDTFFVKPKTQTNIWIQVNHEKNSQQVEMTFMDVPIPKPKPPPLPKLKLCDIDLDDEPIINDGADESIKLDGKNECTNTNKKEDEEKTSSCQLNKCITERRNKKRIS